MRGAFHIENQEGAPVVTVTIDGLGVRGVSKEFIAAGPSAQDLAAAVEAALRQVLERTGTPEPSAYGPSGPMGHKVVR